MINDHECNRMIMFIMAMVERLSDYEYAYKYGDEYDNDDDDDGDEDLH